MTGAGRHHSRPWGWTAALACVLAAACISGDSDPAAVLPDGCAALAAQAGVPADATVIGIRDFAFVPARVTVEVGERVAWVNCEEEGQPAHTTSAVGNEWNSPLLARGDVFLQVMGNEGSYPYRCAPHPFMTGTVVVE